MHQQLIIKFHQTGIKECIRRSSEFYPQTMWWTSIGAAAMDAFNAIREANAIKWIILLRTLKSKSMRLNYCKRLWCPKETSTYRNRKHDRSLHAAWKRDPIYKKSLGNHRQIYHYKIKSNPARFGFIDEQKKQNALYKLRSRPMMKIYARSLSPMFIQPRRDLKHWKHWMNTAYQPLLDFALHQC